MVGDMGPDHDGQRVSGRTLANGIRAPSFNRLLAACTDNTGGPVPGGGTGPLTPAGGVDADDHSPDQSIDVGLSCSICSTETAFDRQRLCKMSLGRPNC